MTQHISVDLETLGDTPAARILSIGAVKFNPYTGEIGEGFTRVIDIEAPGGGDITPGTVLWWMRQSDAARQSVFGKDVERVPLQQALVEFSEFIGFTDELPEDQRFPDIHLWQRGDKDIQWLTSAYEGTGTKIPFAWWAVSDQRTLCRWVADSTYVRPAASTAHDALEDAIYQANCIAKAFKNLGLGLSVKV